MVSDISYQIFQDHHGSLGRGAGIPSPIWSWANSIIAIKRKNNIKVSKFDKDFHNLALEIYKKGYDVRFQTAQVIPVVVTEVITRIIYSVRRLISYYQNIEKENRSFGLLWEYCEPFKNPTVKTMLTVAHGTFCMMDIGDATIRAIFKGKGTFNIVEFTLRLNVPGLGRFSVSLFGEVSRKITYEKKKKELKYLLNEERIIKNYIEGLEILYELYDDKELLTFVEDLKDNKRYIEGFEKTVKLAEKRKVPEDKILKNKSEIDNHFKRRT